MDLRDVPPSIADLIAEPISAITIGRSGAQVFSVEGRDGAALVLKVQPGRHLSDEARRLRWLASRALVPEVMACVDGGRETWLLCRRLEGLMAQDAGRRIGAHRLGCIIGHALRQLHDGPIADCPFPLIKAGALREQARLGSLHRAFDTRPLLNELAACRDPGEAPVLSHGDPSLPNLLIDGDVLGFVDCGEACVIDRHHDLHLCVKSMRYNDCDEGVPDLLTAYGHPVDQARMRFHELIERLKG